MTTNIIHLELIGIAISLMIFSVWILYLTLKLWKIDENLGKVVESLSKMTYEEEPDIVRDIINGLKAKKLREKEVKK